MRVYNGGFLYVKKILSMEEKLRFKYIVFVRMKRLSEIVFCFWIYCNYYGWEWLLGVKMSFFLYDGLLWRNEGSMLCDQIG